MNIMASRARRAGAFLAVLGPLLAAPAGGEVMTHAATATLTLLPDTQNAEVIVQLPRFPEHAGTLVAVGLELGVLFQSRLGLENLGEHPAQVSSELWKMVSATALDGGEPLSEMQVVSGAHFLAPFDGDLDFKGPSGVTTGYVGHGLARAARPLSEPWLTTQGGPRRDFYLELLAEPDASGATPLALQLEMVAHVELRVSYVYVPATPTALRAGRERAPGEPRGSSAPPGVAQR